MKKKCKDCGKEFDAPSDSRYSRYLRKYCEKCSKARKKAYEKIHLISAKDCEEE